MPSEALGGGEVDALVEEVTDDGSTEVVRDKPGAQATPQGRAAATNLRADFDGYWKQIGRPDQDAVKALLAESAKQTAAYAVTATAPKAVPGTTVVSTVIVTSGGKPMAGMPVAFTTLGATVTPARVVTDRTGHATIKVTPTALTYMLTPVASHPLATVRRTPVLVGRQSMIGGLPYGTVKGSCTATTCPVKARISIAAECDDKGQHGVDVDFTVENLPGRYVGVLTIGGAENVIDLAAGENRTVSTKLADRQTLTVEYRILSSAHAHMPRWLAASRVRGAGTHAGPGEG